ncbi:hypothetical protein D3C73_1463410 [compost metagenome]
MDRGPNDWIDTLSEQDIPAEAVNWDEIIADPDEEPGLDAGYLDADATIGEPEADEE